MNAALLLPDADLSDALLDFTRSARSFAANQLLPHARRIDEERTFRRETVTELGAAGYIGGPLKKSSGGGEWSAMQLVLAHEEFGAACANARGFLAVQSGLVAHTIESRGTEAQRKRWLGPLMQGKAIGCFCLTEPSAGTDVGSLQTHAAATADGFTITGEKVWITNGGVADIALVFANAAPERGKDGITCFLVETDRSGFHRQAMPGIEYGHRGSDHAEIEFKAMPATKADVLGGPDAMHTGFMTAMAGLNAGRLSVAAGAVGIHRAALEATATFAADREQFGRNLTSFQMVQERLADMTVELMAARGLVHRCATRRDAGREDAGDLAAAKLYATEAAVKASDTAVMLHGGRGYSSAYPVERFLRDAMGLRIYEGTSLIQKVMLCKALMKG